MNLLDVYTCETESKEVGLGTAWCMLNTNVVGPMRSFLRSSPNLGEED